MDVRRAADLATLSHAEVIGDADRVVGPDVVIDTRLATQGCLFVALPGERVDGHDFVARAGEAGASAALVTRPVDADLTQLVVDDTQRALADIAHGLVSAASHLTTIAITGSAGKTSTKDLLAHVLEAAGPTVSPVGSFNNEIGVPLTATRVGADTRFLVSEMGARGAGHISYLCAITPPAIGVCLNVGTAHLGEFGSVEGIALAKREIVEALPADGWAVLNADDARVRNMATHTEARVALWSLEGRPDGGRLAVWADTIEADDALRHRFTLHVSPTGEETASHPVALQVVGRHQVANALAAATAALCAGLPAELVASALSRAVTRSRWRMEVSDTPAGVTVINDAYNANPDSMRAALATLAGTGQRRRAHHPSAATYAVLGDMLELGEGSVEEHRGVGAAAAELGIDHVLGIGDLGGEIVAGAAAASRDRSRHVRTTGKAHAVALLTEMLCEHDIVLVKASRGMALETIAEALTSGASAPEKDGQPR